MEKKMFKHLKDVLINVPEKEDHVKLYLPERKALVKLLDEKICEDKE